LTASTLKEQVAGLTKNTPTADELLTSFFEDGYKDIVNRLGMINRKELYKFAITDVTYVDVDNALDSEDIIEILSVARGDYPSVEVDANIRGELITGSLFLPTARYPKHYFLNGSLIIVPTPTSTAKGTVSKIILPTITVSGTSIDYFPSKYLHLIVLYASIETLQYRAINYSLPSDLVLPVLPSAITLGTISSSLPTFTAPSSIVLPTAPADADISFTTVDTDKPSWVDPTGIVLPILDLSGITLTIAAFTTPTAPTTPSSPVIGSGQVTLPTSSIPTYIKPVLSLETKLTITDLSISASEPDTPSAPSFSYVDAESAVVINENVENLDSAPTFIKPTVSLESKPTVTDLTISATVPEAPSDPDFTYTDATGATVSATTIDALSTAPSFTEPECEADMSDFDTAYSNDDVELASVNLQKQAQLLQKYQVDIQNSLNEFNEGVTEYQADLQHIIEQARITLQEASTNAQLTTDVSKQNAIQDFQVYVQEYVSNIQKYSGELQSYQATISKEVQEWQANSNKDLTNWQNYNVILLQKYTQDIQNESLNFNSANVKFQADLQRKIENARFALQTIQLNAQLETDVNKQNELQTLQAEIQEYVNALQKYSLELQKYQITVSKEVQEWQVNYTLDLNNWQQYNGALLQQFGQDIQNEQGRFNSSNVQYQAELQKAIHDATNSMSSDVQQFAAILQKYSADLQKWQIDVNSELSEWQQDIVQTAVLEYTTQRANNLQKHQIDTNTELGKFTNNLNKESQEYQNNLNKWSQLINRELQQYQSETGYDISKYSAEIQAVIQKHAQDLQSAVQDFTEEAQKYSLETQGVSSANNSLLTDYQAKLGAYSAELSSNVQSFNTSLQKIQLDYGWIINQIKLLTAEYEKGFVPFQIQQPSEGKE